MSLSHAATMARNGNIRMAAVEGAPEPIFAAIYNQLTGPETTLRRDESGAYGSRWQLTTPERTVKLVRAHDAIRVTHKGDSPEWRIYNRYTLPERGIEPQPGDHVVDVGSFIGEFAWQVADRHDVGAVTAIEPDPRTVECLRFNTPPVVDVEHIAAYYERGQRTLNVATYPDESSLLTPDKGHSFDKAVNVRRLDDIVDAVDYLKVEAEGVEPEVLAGLGEFEPEHVVVNVSPERGGESPASIVDAMLTERGYETEHCGRELFAWL